MTSQRYPSVGLAFLCSALALLSSNVIASTSMSSAGCVEESFADGYCDDKNNSEDCGYDGGDCCSCTCVSAMFDCDQNIAFNCLDPSASCSDDNSDDSSPCDVNYISDGDCDFINNTDECGYDGGDCCECTCVSTSDFTCGDEYHGGYACVDPSASCVDDDDVTTLPSFERFSDTETTTTTGSCLPGFISDGDCDMDNNNEDCGYDGGDCCQCTCVSTDLFTCGNEDDGGFACIDPSAECVDDDDFTDPYYGDDDEFSVSFFFDPCAEEFMGDGDCDASNNNEECGYDGGDCCECTCVSIGPLSCGLNGFDCVDPSASCSDGYVEAGTKTTVGVSANGYDMRPGLAGGDVGCQIDGCAPALTRDGISDDSESRWSCSQSIVPDGTRCSIEFTFEDPQDIVDVDVAFWMGDEAPRTVVVIVNGRSAGRFGSTTGSTFTALGIEMNGVSTFEIATVRLDADQSIDISEVLFKVKA